MALGTISLVVVLSVFNGLEDLLRSLFGSFDPDLQIVAAEGKSFDYNEDVLKELENTPGVAIVIEIVEDNALIKFRKNQSVVRIKGVSASVLEREDLRDNIVEGAFILKVDDQPKAILGRGIQYKLGAPLGDGFIPLQVIYPKNLSKISLNPENALNTKSISAVGAFALEEYYDNNYVFVPLDFAEELFGFENKRTAFEIITKNGVDINQLQLEISNLLGSNFIVKNADEQHEALYKAIKIEKLFVNLAFVFILIIVSFNIFFALSMLALEKRKDISMLYAMGATQKTVTGIFLMEGLIIGLTGMVIGLVVGYGLCYGQQNYGWVSMGLEMAVADAYPLKIKWFDFLSTSIIISIITFLSSINPALLARKSQNLRALYR